MVPWCPQGSFPNALFQDSGSQTSVCTDSRRRLVTAQISGSQPQAPDSVGQVEFPFLTSPQRNLLVREELNSKPCPVEAMLSCTPAVQARPCVSTGAPVVDSRLVSNKTSRAANVLKWARNGKHSLSSPEVTITHVTTCSTSPTPPGCWLEPMQVQEHCSSSFLL